MILRCLSAALLFALVVCLAEQALQAQDPPPQPGRMVAFLWRGETNQPMAEVIYYTGDEPEREDANPFVAYTELTEEEMDALLGQLAEFGDPQPEPPWGFFYAAHLDAPEQTGWIVFETSEAGAAGLDQLAAALPEEKGESLTGNARYVRILAEHFAERDREP